MLDRVLKRQVVTERTGVFTLGVDLGGTKVKTALVDGNGKILVVDKHPTRPERGSEAILADILTCINRCLNKAEQDAKALEIGIAGQVDVTGVVRHAPNLQ